MSLKSYIELIAKKHGGLEGLRTRLAQGTARRSGLESIGFEVAGPVVDQTAAAQRALGAFEVGNEPAVGDRFGLEAIINADLRPVINIVNGSFQSEHWLWTQLSAEPVFTLLKDRLASIGRIELPGQSRIPYGGTGFLVGPGLVMTNRHVAEIFARGLGTRHLAFKPGWRAAIDFVREKNEDHQAAQFAVTSVVMIHPYWDMALLKVALPTGHPHLTLALEDARDLTGHEIAVIGYPAFDPQRNPVDVQNRLFDKRYGVKRLQPGELQGGSRTSSFQKLVDAASHDCSTLGGNSGSAIVDLATGNVLGLHFGGRYQERNYGVPAGELSRDQRVIDAGVAFGGSPRAAAGPADTWWQRVDSAEAPTSNDSGPDEGAVLHATPLPSLAANPGLWQTIEFEVPIRITISVGNQRVVDNTSGADSTGGDGKSLEGLRIVWHEENYSSRRGYDPNFLDADGALPVPMPTAADPAVLALTKDGADVLHYQNFSLRMHHARRLALVTACNVSREAGLRRPEPGRDYGRKALGGLGKNDQEQWFADSRLDEKFQIPDRFFTKDRQAFDKGHLVRRDDVAWGRTYDELRRANGDTYHVTNCSPQVAGFNQAQRGMDNWGDLEDKVFSGAADERLCVFAGPILHPDDQIFHGVGKDGQLRARIPSRFWKVIVAVDDAGLTVFGFVLEQSLANVDFEFVAPAEFLPTMYPLSTIAMLTGVEFDPSLIAADQYDTARGAEVALLAGAGRA